MAKSCFGVPYEKRILPHLLMPQAPQDELWLIGKGKEYVTVNCDLAAALLKRVSASSSILVPGKWGVFFTSPPPPKKKKMA